MLHTVLNYYFLHSVNIKEYKEEFERYDEHSLDNLGKYKDQISKDIRAMLDKKPDFTYDQIKAMLDNLSDLENAKKPHLREIPSDEKDKRAELTEMAKDLQFDYFVNGSVERKILMQNYQLNGPKVTDEDGNIKAKKVNRDTGAFTDLVGYPYTQLYGEFSKERRKKIFMAVVKQMEDLTVKYSQEMSDETFVKEMAKDIKYVFAMSEIQGNQLLQIAKDLDFDVENDQEILDEIALFKDVYSEASVQLSPIVFSRLGYIANPYYKDMVQEDAKCLSEYLDSADVSPLENLVCKEFRRGGFQWTRLIDPDDPELIAYNNARDAETDPEKKAQYKGFERFNPFNDMLADVKFTKSKKVEMLKEQQRGQLADDAARYLKVIAINEYNEYLNGLDDDYDQSYDSVELYNVTDGGKLIGDPLEMTIEEYVEMAKNIQKGDNVICVINGNPVKKFQLTDIDGYVKFANLSLDMASGNSKDVAADLLNEVNSVNHFVFNTTKEFDGLVKSLEELNKIDPDKNKEDFMRKADEAVNFAKDYLNVKMTTDKAFTAKTYKRIDAAKRVVEQLQDIRTMTELCAELRERQAQIEAEANEEKRAQEEKNVVHEEKHAAQEEKDSETLTQEEKNEIEAEYDADPLNTAQSDIDVSGLDDITDEELWGMLKDGIDVGKIPAQKEKADKQKTVEKQIENNERVN